ncbi:hypothetical protein VTK73DRAFT_10288 [Phialemonium thermophilum]|uniref:Alpha N-terminal protein methyltransferase 1 n=1 Tax=Phialemonium thermophilum TaxID=223376 RepID=A0ABR3VXL4_9PEZI
MSVPENENEACPAPDTLINRDDAIKYWEGCEADENSMLGGLPTAGGFSYISRVDLQGSRNFLAKLGIGARPGQRRVASALEGGAGVGRVTEGLLLPVSEHVDVVEPVAKFTAALRERKGVREVYNVGLEDWRPAPGVWYDLIWTQWCVGHLTDEQLVGFLERCKDVLRPDGGVIVIKENMSTAGQDLFDDQDSSVTREHTKFLDLFRRAGLRVVRTEIQKGVHKSETGSLYPIRMYALKPQSQDG